MRFMMLVKADKRTEAGVLPSAADLEKMGRYNEELVRAGVLIDGSGLQPTSKGFKVTFASGGPQVTDGPFVETKEIIAGYWIIDVASREDAVAWARRVPFAQLPSDGQAPEIEVRQMFEVSDFPAVPENVAALDREMKAKRGGQKP